MMMMMIIITIIIIITGSLWLVQRKGGSRNLHQRDVYLWKKHLNIEFNFVFQNEKISQRLNALHQQIWMILSIYKETWVLSKKLHQNYVMCYWSLNLELTIGSISLKNWRHFVRELECLTISQSFCVIWRIPKKNHSRTAIAALKSRTTIRRMRIEGMTLKIQLQKRILNYLSLVLSSRFCITLFSERRQLHHSIS